MTKQLTISPYIEEIKSIQKNLLNYIEDEENIEESYENLIAFFNEHKILQDKHQIKLILILISKITKNHYRTPNFFTKIEKIILNLRDSIKQNLSNSELYNIFKNQKRILFFFFKEKIIEMNQSIAAKMTNDKNNMRYNFKKYFHYEIEPFSSKNKAKNKLPENFEELKVEGNNESEMCQIIRRDSLQDFISHVENKKIALKNKIQLSVYETNSFLIKNSASIIEYAAFFGSIEIFKYLLEQKVEIKPQIYLFAIHGSNMEIIHILEQKQIVPQHKDIIKESIKCHHNEMAQYFIDQFAKEKDEYKESIIEYSFHYHNYSFLTNDSFTDIKQAFIYACKYDFYELAEIFLKMKASSNTNFINLTPISLALSRNHQDIVELLLNSNQKIDNFAFKKCNQLTKLDIPSSINFIGNGSFSECKNLKEISIPSSVDHIGRFAFSGCSSLKVVILPSSLKYLGKFAFGDCTQLTKITIPPLVDVIRDSTFGKCRSLQTVTFDSPSSLQKIEGYAFTSCTSLKEISIPSSVTVIEDNAFIQCNSLSRVSISSKTQFSKDSFPDSAEVIKT